MFFEGEIPLFGSVKRCMQVLEDAAESAGSQWVQLLNQPWTSLFSSSQSWSAKHFIKSPHVCFLPWNSMCTFAPLGFLSFLLCWNPYDTWWLAFFPGRCSLIQTRLPVSPDLPHRVSRKLDPHPRLSLAPRGGDLDCCTCRAAGTWAPSPAPRCSRPNSRGAAGGRVREQVAGPPRGRGPARISLGGRTVSSGCFGRRCFEEIFTFAGQ